MALYQTQDAEHCGEELRGRRYHKERGGLDVHEVSEGFLDHWTSKGRGAAFLPFGDLNPVDFDLLQFCPALKGGELLEGMFRREGEEGLESQLG